MVMWNEGSSAKLCYRCLVQHLFLYSWMFSSFGHIVEIVNTMNIYSSNIKKKKNKCDVIMI